MDGANVVLPVEPLPMVTENEDNTETIETIGEATGSLNWGNWLELSMLDHGNSLSASPSEEKERSDFVLQRPTVRPHQKMFLMIGKSEKVNRIGSFFLKLKQMNTMTLHSRTQLLPKNRLDLFQETLHVILMIPRACCHRAEADYS